MYWVAAATAAGSSSSSTRVRKQAWLKQCTPRLRATITQWRQSRGKRVLTELLLHASLAELATGVTGPC